MFRHRIASANCRCFHFCVAGLLLVFLMLVATAVHRRVLCTVAVLSATPTHTLIVVLARLSALSYIHMHNTTMATYIGVWG